MPKGSKKDLKQFFELLMEKEFELGEDPELASLHTQAARHFSAAAYFNHQDTLDWNAEYELEQARYAIDRFDEISDYDKGIDCF